MAVFKSMIAGLLVVFLFGVVFGVDEEVDPDKFVDSVVRRVSETHKVKSTDGKQQIQSSKVVINTSERKVEQQVVETVTNQGGTSDDNDDFLEDDTRAEDGIAAQVVQEPGQPQPGPAPRDGQILLDDWAFILIVVACVAVGVLGIAVAFLCWYKIQTTNKAQSEAEYPAYGLTGPSTQVASNMTNGDRKLAQSAQMYHYQHQKQQMIAMEKREKGEVQGNAESDYDSEEENEDGDLTVYECPGLAPTGEMQVKNPLFTEDHRSEASSVPEEKQ